MQQQEQPENVLMEYPVFMGYKEVSCCCEINIETSLLLVCGFAQLPNSEWFKIVRAAQGHSSTTSSSAKN